MALLVGLIGILVFGVVREVLFHKSLAKSPDCYGEALEDFPDAYSGSVLAVESELNDPTFGYIQREYVSADPPEDIAQFYVDRYDCSLRYWTNLDTCGGLTHSPYIVYTAAIEAQEDATYYTLIAEWNCRGLD